MPENIFGYFKNQHIVGVVILDILKYEFRRSYFMLPCFGFPDKRFTEATQFFGEVSFFTALATAFLSQPHPIMNSSSVRIDSLFRLAQT